MNARDVVVIGAGPAGLAAATLLAREGVAVTLIDEQGTPGGQIFRAIETTSPGLRSLLGREYARGERLVADFRSSGADYRPRSTAWQITPGAEIWLSRDGASSILTARVVILATGAMERAVPLPGWTLPGVMSAGAMQILLKTGGLVARDVVLAGSGPLLYLLGAQLVAAGAPPRAIVDTQPRGALFRALPDLPDALSAAGITTIAKGVALQGAIRAAGVAWHRHASDLRVEGRGAARAISFRVRGERRRIETTLVALHEGVIPVQQAARSIGCAFDWDATQRAFRPRLDAWGASSVDGVLIAGDAGGIAGARAAEYAGRVAAWEALRRLGRIDAAARDARSAATRRALAGERAVRPFLDALFPPPDAVLAPADDVIVCRCEEVTAGAIRRIVEQGCQGPNQAKSFLRAGMGPCQARICGPVVSAVIAAARGVTMDATGYVRVRPPLKPVTVGELAAAVAGA